MKPIPVRDGRKDLAEPSFVPVGTRGVFLRGPTVETVGYGLSPRWAGMSLAEPKERIHFRSKVEAMDKSADRQRDFDAFVMSAKGETSPKSS